MLRISIASLLDVDPIRQLMNLSIDRLQNDFLTPDQVAASRMSMGLDLELIHDGTYFRVEENGTLVGCGGWSRRATLYGGDHSAGRDPRLLDPETEPARIRAMYTHPDHVRKGVGTLIIETAEKAASAEGFGSIVISATMAGIPLYSKSGYRITDEWFDTNGAVPVPLATMVKVL